ncbi:MAG: phosphate signaling complex protein PhoU [Epulopiscium sp.]|nr:phosphate signaling complex protein PhoU [Candidatus Epulonipiscium sp.]
MRTRFDNELEILNTQLIEMGAQIENAIENAVKALETKNINFAKKAIEFDSKVNGMEKEIENRCLKLLLQQHPVAGDLRLISTAMRMITDMERIGDQAADIAEITLRYQNQLYIKKLVHIPKMAEAVIKMVHESIDAFVARDLDLAKSVILYDDIVDELFITIREELIELIHLDKENGEQAMDLFMIAKYLERIGDHATNIAEWVVFSITGEHVDLGQ